MKRIWVARIFYYLFYAFIFFIAFIIFIEILDYRLLESNFGKQIIELISKLQF